jgi:transposase
MAKGYPPEFRCRVLDLIASGRKVADIARDLGVSGQTIYKLASAGSCRPWGGARPQERRARRAGDAQAADQPARGGARRHQSAPRAAERAVRPKAVRGYRGDGQGGPRGAGLVPHPGGLRVRVLRPTLPAIIGSGDSSPLAHGLITEVHARSRGPPSGLEPSRNSGRVPSGPRRMPWAPVA